MLKIIAKLPESKHFRQIQNRGERYQWEDRASSNLRILSAVPHPWGQEWAILIRLEQGKTRAEISYPKRLNLVCMPIDPNETNLQRAIIVRDRWTGNFAHSTVPTLLHFDFPVETSEGNSWLMISVIAEK